MANVDTNILFVEGAMLNFVFVEIKRHTDPKTMKRITILLQTHKPWIIDLRKCQSSLLDASVP